MMSAVCLSWTRRDIPAARETVPRAVFDKLFRRSNEGFVNRSVIEDNAERNQGHDKLSW